MFWIFFVVGINTCYARTYLFYCCFERSISNSNSISIINRATHNHALKLMNDVEEEIAYCISFADVQAAAKRIEGIAHRTPVLTSQSLDEMMNADVSDTNDAIDTNDIIDVENRQTRRRRRRQCHLFFKVEALQKTGSFKFRGALNAVRSILEQQQQHQQQHQQQQQQQLAVVTHSSGNHAQALALAAKLSCSNSSSSSNSNNPQQQQQVHATIVMPQSTPQVKMDAVVAFGGTPMVVANTNAAREEACERIRQETGATFVHPSEDPRVIAGQGTIAAELLQQVSSTTTTTDLQVVIIPVGGGGLAAGNTIALRALRGRNIKIVLAEPATMDDAHRSFVAQQLRHHHIDNPLDSVADGLKTTLGPNTWPIIRDLVDDIYTVSETDILRATKIIWERLKIMIEPSAGVGVAVALFHPEFRAKYCCCGVGGGSAAEAEADLPSVNIGIVLCGGNVDVVKIAAKMKDIGL